MPIVRMPDGTQVQFPDEMPPDQIRSLIASKFPEVDPNNQASQDAAMIAAQSGGITPEQGQRNLSAVGQTIANIPGSALNAGEAMVQPIIHPIQTAENIGNIGKGILQKFGVVGGNDAEKYADAVGSAFMNKYGTFENVAKTIQNDPVGALMDLSTVLSGLGLAAKLPGVAGEVGNVAKTVGNATNPLSAVGAAARSAGNVGAEVLGVTTGAGPEAIRTAARSGAAGGDAAQAFKEGMAGGDAVQTVAQAKAAVNQLRQERGASYRDAMDQLKVRGSQMGIENEILDFSKIDAAVNKVASVKNFKGQDLSPATKDVRAAITDTINEWRDLPPADFHTVEGLDALKQKIGDIRDGTDPNTPARVIADQVYQGVRNTIIEQAPEYAKIMKGYEDASNLIREMEKTLSLNPKASIDTTLRKLQSVLRNNVNTNYGRRAELMDFLVRSGAPNLMERLAGQALSSVAPRGLARAVAGGEGASALGAAALGHPLAAAALGGGILASSPAIVGGTAYGLGAATRLPLRGAGLTGFQLGRQPE